MHFLKTDFFLIFSQKMLSYYKGLFQFTKGISYEAYRAALAAFMMIFTVSCAHEAEQITSDALPPPLPAVSVSAVGELSEEVRGAWIASVYNINYPVGVQI